MEEKQRNRILTVLFIGVLMAALDIAIVGPALPAIQKAFTVSDRTLTWMFSIYVLFNLIGTPLMAKLSDQFGRRAIYVLDIALFALGSLMVAFSTAFPLVLIGRAIQGTARCLAGRNRTPLALGFLTYSSPSPLQNGFTTSMSGPNPRLKPPLNVCAGACARAA